MIWMIMFFCHKGLTVMEMHKRFSINLNEQKLVLQPFITQNYS